MPVKFDDIGKVASEQLNDDYQTSGYVLKAKQKTSYGGTELSSQVDLFQSKEPKAVATPAKLTWKWPNPFGYKQVFVDKLELDKTGKLKLEASSGQVQPGLKLECKSADVPDPAKLMAGFTYTAIKNAQVKFETKALKPADFTGEVTYAKDAATLGLKMNKSGVPDVGVRVLHGDYFVSLVTKDKFKVFTSSVFYKANDDFKVAATYTHGGGDHGKSAIGINYKGIAKVKMDQSQTLSLGVKHVVSKGFTLLGGASFGILKGGSTFGLQLSIA